ncbi:MarR family winged helix-turn-helix transcriptional regulator [Polymorphobacter sp.]|uniref:MarR family winged helix-turn-helix transcriptional regulator n=1 Tax=Polymorphobacter sp. TaxID=1909290 RepID=UPI003F6FE992
MRDHCLCFATHRAARALARRFDAALAPYGLTSGQFSLMMALNRPEAPRLGDLALFLAMDRTTLTANLKPLERAGLVSIQPDETDKRSRRPRLTRQGEAALAAAVPTWQATHELIDVEIVEATDLRHGLALIAGVG